jgi:hypothetical protein
VHRKGSTYDELIVGLQMADEGQQKILRPNSLSPRDFASKAHGLNRARKFAMKAGKAIWYAIVLAGHPNHGGKTARGCFLTAEQMPQRFGPCTII